MATQVKGKLNGLDTTFQSADIAKQYGVTDAQPLDSSMSPPSLPNPGESIIPTPVSTPTANTAIPNAPQFYIPKTPVAGYDPQTVFNAQNQPLSKEQYLQQGGKVDFSNVTKGYEAAKASGVPPPQTEGEAASAMAQFTPQTPQAPQLPPEVDNFFQTNPIVQPSLQQLTEFLSPASTRKELSDTMSRITSTMGEASGLKLELMDAKRVMEGTDQDIRDEVEKAGGFATESQVQALTVGRNKTLLKRASMIQDQLSYMQDVINTDMTMYGFQKDMANQEFQQRSFLLNYKQKNDEMIYKAAQDAINRNLQLLGPDGLYNATGGDPVKVDRLERAMGLAKGGLQQAALQAMQEKLRKQEKEELELDKLSQDLVLDRAQFGLDQQQLELDEKKLELDTRKTEAEIAKIISDMSSDGNKTEIENINGQKTIVTYDKQGNLINSQPITTAKTEQEQAQSRALSKGNIDLVSDILEKAKNPTSVSLGTSGLTRSLTVNPFSSKKADFIAGVQQLTSQLSLDSLIRAKASGATFGALSEGELNVLASSASKINSWAIKDKNGNVIGYNTSPASFKKELDRINNFAKMDYVLKGGNPEDVSVQKMGDGTLWTKNSDGSMTKLLDKVPDKSSFNPVGKTIASKSFGQTFGTSQKYYGSPVWSKGLDYVAKKGTEIPAPISGTVIEAGPKPGWGNTIVIDMGNGLKARFSHLDKIQVKAGEKVSQQMLLGTIGNTGNVLKSDGTKPTAKELAAGRGAHLDLTIYKDGKALSASQVDKLMKSIG